jgi:VanZ family protein
MTRTIPLDKQLHLLLCFAICTVASIVNPVVGVVAALAAGLLKEWHDSRQQGNSWSWGDVAFDMAGTVCAAVAVYLLKTF